MTVTMERPERLNALHPPANLELGEVFDEFGAKYDGSIADNSDHTSSACYGISISLRDYALFHQWLAQGKGPKSYYASARDVSKTKIQENEFGALYSKGTPITYGSQTWYLAEHDILMSYGSYGQVGLSDMKTGVAVIFQQDWAVNTNFDKFYATRDLALAVIQRVTAASAESKNR